MPPGMTSSPVASTSVWPVGEMLGPTCGDGLAVDQHIGALLAVGGDDGAVLDQGAHDVS